MKPELLHKDDDGTYRLTAPGETAVTLNATRKLIRYYLVKGMGRSIELASTLLEENNDFIRRHFGSVNEGLKYLDELSARIGESNRNRFRAFISKHFVPTLDKEKNALLERELPAARAKYDNPYWTPSYELLARYGNLFTGLPPLSGSFSGAENAAPGTGDTLTHPHHEKAPPESKTDTLHPEPEQNAERPLGSEREAIEKTPSPPEPEPFIFSTPENQPGVLLLQSFGGLFQNAAPLPPESFFLHTPHPGHTEHAGHTEEAHDHDTDDFASHFAGTAELHSNDSAENQLHDDAISTGNLTEDHSSAQAGSHHPVAAFLDPNDPRMTGEKVLELFGALFENSPALSHTHLESKDAPGAGANLPLQVSLRHYTGMVNVIRKFTRENDQAGYQQWYARQNPKLRGALRIHGLLNAIEKGQSIDWKSELSSMGASLQLEEPVLNRIRLDIEHHKLVINSISTAVRNAKSGGAETALLQNIYSQSIQILSGTDTTETQKAELQVLCMGIADETARLKLQADLLQIPDL